MIRLGEVSKQIRLHLISCKTHIQPNVLIQWSHDAIVVERMAISDITVRPSPRKSVVRDVGLVETTSLTCVRCQEIGPVEEVRIEAGAAVDIGIIVETETEVKVGVAETVGDKLQVDQPLKTETPKAGIDIEIDRIVRTNHGEIKAGRELVQYPMML